METVSFNVMKMGCGACVGRVTKALGTVPGVEVVSVKPGQAIINRDPVVADDARVIAALKVAGYDASPEVRHGSADAGNAAAV